MQPPLGLLFFAHTSKRGGRFSARTAIEQVEARVLLSVSSAASFISFPAGVSPLSSVTVDSSGNLFGTTENGGASGDGTVFEIAKGSSTITTLATFNGANGEQPRGAVTFDSSGNLFGTTETGGASGDGTIFEIPKGSSALTTIASFDITNGAFPFDAVTFDSSGNLFGTSETGGASSDGTVFEIPKGSGALSTVASFSGANGANPFSTLVLDSKGDLFGTASGGGADSDGTVFEIAKGSSALTAVASFDGDNGAFSEAAVAFDSNGNLFGTTEGGGADGNGSVFEIAKGTSAIDTIASFDTTNGAYPYNAVAFDSSGNLFGTTYSGGANDFGAVFEIASGSNALTTVASFGGSAAASNPFAAVAFDSSGNLFGTTAYGANGAGGGTVFELAAVSTAASKLAIAAGPINGTAGVPLASAVVVDVENSSGNIVTTNTSTVTLTLSSGTFSNGSKTATAVAAGGVATFSGLTIDKTGSYTLTASDGSLAPATSASFTISAAAAAKLAFSTQPANGTAGVAIPTVDVSVEDAFGNVVATNASSVMLAIASGPAGGTIVGTTTAKAASGVAAFSGLKFQVAGAYTLKGSDGSLSAATSASFTVAPAAAARLVIVHEPPAAGTAGVALAPATVVDVEDAFGNVVTTDSSKVTLALSAAPTGGALSGTASVSAVKGIATFSNLILNKVGVYSLKATDGALSTAVSTNITISPGAASALIFIRQPTSAVANTVLSPAIELEVVDAFGNLVSSDFSTVTLAIKSGPSGGKLTFTLTIQAYKGIAEFGKLYFTAPGTYTLVATDGALTKAISMPIVVAS